MALQFQGLSRFIERRIAVLGSVLVIGVLVVWILTQFIPQLGDWVFSRGLFNVILIALVVDLLNRVVELKGSPPGLQVFDGQDEVMPYVVQFVEDESPKTADLLEYSTSTIRPLLDKLRKANARIRLLVCDPKVAISDQQRAVIEGSLANLRRDFKSYRNLQVRCYRTPASLRGRSLGGELVTVGWYTYQHEDDELLLAGHSNAMVLATTDTRHGRSLEAMFARTFEALWNDPQTVVLPEVPARGAPAEAPRP
jgi:hypothetical protein